MEGYLNLALEDQINKSKLFIMWSWRASSLLLLVRCSARDKLVKDFSWLILAASLALLSDRLIYLYCYKAFIQNSGI